MKKELSPVATVIVIAVVLVAALGLGWKFVFSSSSEDVVATQPAPPANLGPPGFQGMDAERAAIRNRAQSGGQTQ